MSHKISDLIKRLLEPCKSPMTVDAICVEAAKEIKRLDAGWSDANQKNRKLGEEMAEALKWEIESERLRMAIYSAERTTPGHAKSILQAALQTSEARTVPVIQNDKCSDDIEANITFKELP